MRILKFSALAAAIWAACIFEARAQEYPNRPLTFVVPFTPGAATDFLARLLGKMDAVVEGNGLTMLDNSVVLHVSEIQKPDSHGQDHMPFMLAGKAGGKLSGGRVLPGLTTQRPHNDLLVSLLNLFDVPVTTFGHADFCTGAYPGLV